MLEYYLAARIDTVPRSLRRISISPSGRWLALAAADTVILVDMNKYQVRHQIQCAAEVNDLAWTPSGLLLCTRGSEIASIDISLADRDGQIEISGYPLKMEVIKYIAAINIGDYTCIAVGGNAVIQLVICAASTWTLVGVLDQPRPTAFSGSREIDISSLNWCKGPDGQLTLVVSYLYHGVVGWAVSLGGSVCTSTISWAIATEKCYRCAVSADGSKIAVSKEGEGFHLYSQANSSQTHQFRIPPESAGSSTPVYFVHDDLFLIGGSQTGDIRLWDVSSGTRVQSLKDMTSTVVDISAYHRLEDDKNTDVFVIAGATMDAVYIWKAGEH